jgi:hypothetical protein
MMRATTSASRIILVIVAFVTPALPATSLQTALFSQYHRSGIHSLSSRRRRGKTLLNLMHAPTELEVKRLVLVGGGHAHVQVIKALNAQSRPTYLHVTLIDVQSSASYSGMVPGCVSKLYTLDQVQIALDKLANWSEIEFVCGKVVGMTFDDNCGQKQVIVEVTDDNGDTVQKEYPFDVVSVDIGSTTRDLTTIPGAQQYTISTRPISDLVRRIEKEEEILKEKIRYVNRILDCGLWIIYISFNSLHFQLWCN